MARWPEAGRSITSILFLGPIQGRDLLATQRKWSKTANLVDWYNGQLIASNWTLTSAGGSSYDFSYIFVDNTTPPFGGPQIPAGEVEGSFDASGGSLSGGLTGITDISISYEGPNSSVFTPIAGTFLAYHYVGAPNVGDWPANYALGGAVVSSDANSSNFVFAAVPEPSTWAMLIAGFAGLGLAGYRKAKTRAAAA